MSYDPQEMMRLTQNGYDRMAADWSSTRQTFWPELVEKINNFILTDSYNAKIRLLDVGCGNGRLLSVLDHDRVDYLGVDVSKELLAIAKQKYPDHNFALVDPDLDGLLLLDDVENTNVEAWFDRIVCIAVLHHVPPSEAEKWLKNIYDVTEDDAHLLFTTWNLTNTYYQLDEDGDAVIDFMNYKESRYVHNYDPEEIGELFESVGFEIIEISEMARSTDSGMSNIVILAKKPYDYEI